MSGHAGSTVSLVKNTLQYWVCHQLAITDKPVLSRLLGIKGIYVVSDLSSC